MIDHILIIFKDGRSKSYEGNTLKDAIFLLHEESSRQIHEMLHFDPLPELEVKETSKKEEIIESKKHRFYDQLFDFMIIECSPSGREIPKVKLSKEKFFKRLGEFLEFRDKILKE